MKKLDIKTSRPSSLFITTYICEGVSDFCGLFSCSDRIVSQGLCSVFSHNDVTAGGMKGPGGGTRVTGGHSRYARSEDLKPQVYAPQIL